jgi:hypothetical protein
VAAISGQNQQLTKCLTYACHTAPHTKSDNHLLLFKINGLSKERGSPKTAPPDSPAPVDVKRIFNIFFCSPDSALQQNVWPKKGVESERFFALVSDTVKKIANPLTFNSSKFRFLALALTA